MIDKAILEKAKEYIQNEKDDKFRKEIEDLIQKDDAKELEDRFYTDLEFGTGGIRGLMGGGLNRMNPFVLGRATQGFSNYLIKNGVRDSNGDLSAVISYDSRNNSLEFAKCVALVFCANGIKTKIFSSLRPTPVLSFAIRHLGASSGVMLTASHNPKEYNGYKAYWHGGIQVTPPHDSNIIDEVSKVTQIKTITEKEAIERGLLEYIDKEIDDAFILVKKNWVIEKDLFKGSPLKVVYTPLSGAGLLMNQRILRELGIEPIIVESQKEPDGNFPTAPYPNPEEKSTFDEAIKTADSCGAKYILASDPDADRLGFAIKKDGKWVILSGNQHGSLLLFDILTTLKKHGKLNSKSYFVNTIVTTELQNKIANDFGVKNDRVLTGFKWLASKMDENIKDGYNIIMSTEESIGYLIGDDLRDKDSVGALASTVEMILRCEKEGITPLERLDQIYAKYGYHMETQISKSYPGKEGKDIIANMMKAFRENPPKSIAGEKVVKIKDIEKLETNYVIEGKVLKDIDLPKSNVIQIYLEGGSILNARPSGTEPKIKFYVLTVAKNEADARNTSKAIEKDLEEFIKNIK